MQEIPLDEIAHKDTSPAPKRPKLNFYLYLVASIANLLGFSTGNAIVWVAPVLPKLLSSADNPLGRVITHSEASWVAGLLPLGAIFGPFLAGKIADKIGRKKSLLVLALIKVGSLLITAYAHSIWLYYVSRFSIGVAIGTVFAVLPMYLAEIAQNHNRGTLACSMGVFIAIGFNFTFLLGPYLTIQNFSLVCLAPLAVFLPCFVILCPESPVFLATKHERKQLVKSLLKLRNQSIETEIALLETSQNREPTTSGLTNLLKTKSLRKAFVISLGLISLQQSAGVSAIMSYLQTIFEATGSKFAPEICAMITGTFQVFGTVLASTIVDKAGRKILLLCSSAGMSVTLLLLAVYFYLQGHKFAVVAKLSWLPVLSLVVFILAFSFGLGPVPWAVMAEVFPASVRSLAASATSVTCFVNTFVVTVAFPSMALFCGMSNCFLIFAMICLVGTVFIYKVVPETKGRSLQEIQKLLEGK
ncbi:facilitated trehalose transporter Tret1 [Tribolium castaneum]|uniref:facilitated trehalose transporter Tret1 n=1 Tax=Tribolium castaneum TaxID=7070 RepID=UPI0000D56E02|nr:PREDICTED: facilitated trehalose transporter Tret1 [Tribolium castaneum]|eukprot:XP_972238.1 PREDICTED: facilitated trehalose transporter Tret1 [Tribolium castaneum]